MKHLIPLLFLASCHSIQKKTETVIPRAYPIAEVVVEKPWFFMAEWDKPVDWKPDGYFIYLGTESGVYLGNIKLDLHINLHDKEMVPILWNHDKTFVAISAYLNDGYESPKSNEAEWPIPLP